MTKNTSGDELLKAAGEVFQNRKYICAEMKEIIAGEQSGYNKPQHTLDLLNKKELEIISYIRQGLSSKEIAIHISAALKTIETHRYKILKKPALSNTASLMNYIHRSEFG